MIEVKFTCDKCKKQFNPNIHGYRKWYDKEREDYVCSINISASCGIYSFNDFYDKKTICEDCYQAYTQAIKDAEIEAERKFWEGEQNSDTN